jgi:hypothetical protein
MPDLLTGIACREIPARLQARAAGDLRRPVSGGAAGAGLSPAGAAAATGAGEGTPCGESRGIESRPVSPPVRAMSRARADGRAFAGHQLCGMEGSDRA